MIRSQRQKTPAHAPRVRISIIPSPRASPAPPQAQAQKKCGRRSVRTIALHSYFTMNFLPP